MKSIEVNVPRLLIRNHLPHPENYGESLVELLNGMVTDVYTNDKGDLFTLTNDSALAKYLNHNNLDETNYQLSDCSISLITIKQSDKSLVLSWMNADIKDPNSKYETQDIRVYISHAITFNAHLFIIKKDALAIGLAGYTVIDKTAVIHLKLYVKDAMTHQDENLALSILLKHIRQGHNVSSFKTIVPENDTSVNQLYLRNSFEKEVAAIENQVENVYCLNMSDLERGIDYSLKVYANLVLSQQLHQRDEIDEHLTDDNGYLCIEDDLVEKFNAMMKLLHGEDLKIAKEYKSLMFVALDVINRHIKCYQDLSVYTLKSNH